MRVDIMKRIDFRNVGLTDFHWLEILWNASSVNWMRFRVAYVEKIIEKAVVEDSNRADVKTVSTVFLGQSPIWFWSP